MTAIVIGVESPQVSGTLVTTTGAPLVNEFRKGDASNPIATMTISAALNQIFFVIFNWDTSDAPSPTTAQAPFLTIRDSAGNDLVKLGASSQLVAFLLPVVDTIPGDVDIIIDPVTVGVLELTIYSSLGGIS